MIQPARTGGGQKIAEDRIESNCFAEFRRNVSQDGPDLRASLSINLCLFYFSARVCVQYFVHGQFLGEIGRLGSMHKGRLYYSRLPICYARDLCRIVRLDKDVADMEVRMRKAWFGGFLDHRGLCNGRWSVDIDVQKPQKIAEPMPLRRFTKNDRFGDSSQV